MSTSLPASQVNGDPRPDNHSGGSRGAPGLSNGGNGDLRFPPPDRNGKIAQIRAILSRSARLLPAQGPITAFVFLNTLQALEDLPFDQAVRYGAELFRCEPYLSESAYRAHYRSGRINRGDLYHELEVDLGARGQSQVGPQGTRLDLRLAMLTGALHSGPESELEWFLAETEALARFGADVPETSRSSILAETRRWAMHESTVQHAKPHGVGAPLWKSGFLKQPLATLERWNDSQWEPVALDAIWAQCRAGVEGLPTQSIQPPPPCRLRDVVLSAWNVDSDEIVDGALVPFCAAFVDQGLAHWELPRRDEGFLASFRLVFESTRGIAEPWQFELAQLLAALPETVGSPCEIIFDSLIDLGVPESNWGVFITATLTALKGWAGLLWQMETRGDRVPRAVPAGTLSEFLAARLLLERAVLRSMACERFRKTDRPFGKNDTLANLASRLPRPETNGSAPTNLQRALNLFQLAQIRGWGPADLASLSSADWSALVEEVAAFPGIERRRLFHGAFERNFRRRALDAISHQASRPAYHVERPLFQAVFCIDTREESFRRHLEEKCPAVETFGAAGFFSVPMYYKGVSDAHSTALCPIVVFPKHWVVEEPVYPLKQQHRKRRQVWKALGAATHSLHQRSRGLAGAAALFAGVGVLASIPLVARVLFPRLTSNLQRHMRQFVEPNLLTRLRIERTAEPPGPEGDHVGFSLAEMIATGERILRDIGLTSRFARFVLFAGHGSFCLNNPHKSAYDCGACSGGAGGPNARALAMMLNDSRVRAGLAERGIVIPIDTRFVGGLHNTCNDSVQFFDVDMLPSTHHADFERIEEILDDACRRNAHERCRRFRSAPLNLSMAEALEHVETRAEDLAQTRPEFGNATNAMCFVGRRSRIRGLYLDRRSFMHSYDPLQDDAEYEILGRILAAVGPVCSGINLQYFFSYVDSPGWGCGTKLPHNITSLLGVMDGAASDFRTGLPWQGVEIHEPLRLLLVIEAPPEAILKIMDRNPAVRHLVQHDWIQLAMLDPHSNAVVRFEHGRFRPYIPSDEPFPTAPSSWDWYRGSREHLKFCEITPGCDDRPTA